ncbi:DUF2207 domain-containing protein [Subtercola sp. YIM 133946]|uniref:DUF2207 domain-containing protein n=1 Tax=Subtercola sp. YIM 133946 TaxID=3118909 RepID=UPI002F942C1E
MTADPPHDPNGTGDGTGEGTGDDDHDSPTDAGYYRAEAEASERIPAPAPHHSRLWVVLSRWLLDLEAWLRSHGGRGLRFGLRFFWGLVALGGVILLVGPIINPPLTLDDITQSASTVTDRWIAREFAVDYQITRTPQGALTAHVTENISANLPAGTDESGIQRVLATQYQSHALHPSNIAATIDGASVEVGSTQTADQQTLTIDGPRRLSGDHQFVLQYDLANLAYSTTDDATGRNVDLLEWNVFGPSWPQGLAGLDVRVTIPKELNDRLVRQPRGSLAWTLLSSGEWLSPEPAGSGTGAAGAGAAGAGAAGADASNSDDVTYRFTNDQNIPPHAEAWFTLSFEPGTFTMPAPTALYWVQVWGPLAPLALLAGALLLALAARAVAWSDARGRPWFVAQFDPPKDVTARMAAQIIRSAQAFELAGALADAQAGSGGLGAGTGSADSTGAGGTRGMGGTRGVGGTRGSEGTHGARPKRASGAAAGRRHDRLVAAAKVARRTGRIGDRPRALSRYLTAPERRAQQAQGLRRVPRGFVRDFFIAASIALTLVQWGLVRQLSHQAKLAVVWWPVAFVIVSTVIAAVVLTIALTARPLTRRGALVKQYLQGIGANAERTQLLDRGVASERVLPYAVLLAPARDAGEKTVALIETELGEPGASTRWRTGSFLTWPRLLIRALAIVFVAGAIAAAALLPDPSARSNDYIAYSGDVAGTLDTKVQSMDAVATLIRTADRHAKVDVTETLTVSFSDDSSQVPQFAQQWPSELNGQNLGLVVTSVTLDGAAVPFAVEQQPEQQGSATQLMRTELADVVTGSHAVVVSYSLESAAVAAAASSGAGGGTHSGDDANAGDGAGNGSAGVGGGTVDRVRWAALLDGWQYDSQWGDDPAPKPLRMEFVLSDELAGLATRAGWISLDTDSDSARDWTASVVPFGSLEAAAASPAAGTATDAATATSAGEATGTPTGTTAGAGGGASGDDDGATESSDAGGGTQRHVLDLAQNPYGSWPFDVTVDDVGASADFPAETFAGPSAQALQAVEVEGALPTIVILSLGALGFVFGVLGTVVGAQRRRQAFDAGPVRDLVWWLAPGATLATIILFVWATLDMPADDPAFVPLAVAAVAALLACASGLVLTRRSRRAGRVQKERSTA